MCAVILRLYSVSGMRPRMEYLGCGSRSFVTVVHVSDEDSLYSITK